MLRAHPELDISMELIKPQESSQEENRRDLELKDDKEECRECWLLGVMWLLHPWTRGGYSASTRACQQHQLAFQQPALTALAGKEGGSSSSAVRGSGCSGREHKLSPQHWAAHSSNSSLVDPLCPLQHSTCHLHTQAQRWKQKVMFFIFKKERI